MSGVASRLLGTEQDTRAAEIARRLQAARIGAGFSVADVVDRLGIARDTLWQWERGSTAPDARRLAVLLDLYRVSADWILARDHATGTAFVLDPRVERLLLETGSWREWIGRLSQMSVRIDDRTEIVTDHLALARRIDAVIGHGAKLHDHQQKDNRG